MLFFQDSPMPPAPYLKIAGSWPVPDLNFFTTDFASTSDSWNCTAEVLFQCIVIVNEPPGLSEMSICGNPEK